LDEESIRTEHVADLFLHASRSRLCGAESLTAGRRALRQPRTHCFFRNEVSRRPRGAFDVESNAQVFRGGPLLPRHLRSYFLESRGCLLPVFLRQLEHECVIGTALAAIPSLRNVVVEPIRNDVRSFLRRVMLTLEVAALDRGQTDVSR
jgi:hypothetical protein